MAMTRKKIRVLVVDDSALIRAMFTEFLDADPDLEVIGEAVDPYDAREKIKQLNPDVITLDVEMPKMDGISFLEKIMTLRPMPVVMVSTLTQKGADITIRALEIGAVDAIGKPSANDAGQLEAIRHQLAEKVKNAARANVSATRTPTRANPNPAAAFEGNPRKSLIAIGASTGGVEAIRDVLLALPADMPPIILTQHMPPMFTKSFAARLDKLTNLHVEEATHGTVLQPGHAYLAPGGYHLQIKKRQGVGFITQLLDSELVCGHKPSVDVMFDSVAEEAGKITVATILTGMGKDGAAGMKRLRDAGAITLGEAERTCVVYGMPKAAKAAGGIMKELPLPLIGKEILSICNARK